MVYTSKTVDRNSVHMCTPWLRSQQSQWFSIIATLHPMHQRSCHLLFFLAQHTDELICSARFKIIGGDMINKANSLSSGCVLILTVICSGEVCVWQNQQQQEPRSSPYGGLTQSHSTALMMCKVELNDLYDLLINHEWLYPKSVMIGTPVTSHRRLFGQCVI